MNPKQFRDFTANYRISSNQLASDIKFNLLEATALSANAILKLKAAQLQVPIFLSENEHTKPQQNVQVLMPDLPPPVSYDPAASAEVNWDQTGASVLHLAP